MFRSRRTERSGGQAGQALVFMVVAMIPALLMVALIVDGGNAWAQQRVAQNGSDSASEGGATVLAQRFADATAKTDAQWDAAVAAAVVSNADANGVDVLTGGLCDPGVGPCAYYTDVCGTLLRPDGTKATGYADAAVVGTGLPPNVGSNPDCDNGTIGPVAGVAAVGDRPFGTFFAGVAGIATWTARATATAVAGYLQDGLMIPVSFNISITYCDSQGDSTLSSPPVGWPKNTVLVLPICKHGPGNVGWLDWEAPNGGTSELINCIENPCNNPDITLAQWLQVAQSGGTSSKALEDALNEHDGDVVLLPLFDGTCSTTPDNSQANGVSPFGCSSPDYGEMHGTTTWYRIYQIGAFQLCSPSDPDCGGYSGAYINGNNKTECSNSPYSMPAPEDQKATNCLIGKFVDFIQPGDVVGTQPGRWGSTKAIGVQLIK